MEMVVWCCALGDGGVVLQLAGRFQRKCRCPNLRVDIDVEGERLRAHPELCQVLSEFSRSSGSVVDVPQVNK